MRRTARKRSRNCETGGKRSAMCESETSGGGSASSRSVAASCSGSCGASFRSGRGASGAGPMRKNRSRSPASRSASQAGRLLHPAVLGEPARELFGGLLRLELGELGLLVREERARLQLEQRRDQDEELAAGLEIELVALRKPLDESDHDRGHVDRRPARAPPSGAASGAGRRGPRTRRGPARARARPWRAAEASGGVGRGRAGRPSSASARRAVGLRGVG